MTEPESGALKHVRNARVNVGLVTVVRPDFGAQKGRQVFVHDDGLQRGDHPSPGGLENVLVEPIRVLLLDHFGLDVVPPVEHDAERQKGRVLVNSRVAQN